MDVFTLKCAIHTNDTSSHIVENCNKSMKSVIIDEINHLYFDHLTPGVSLHIYLGGIVLT